MERETYFLKVILIIYRCSASQKEHLPLLQFDQNFFLFYLKFWIL